MTSLSDGFQISKWFRKENLVSPTQISQSAHFIHLHRTSVLSYFVRLHRVNGKCQDQDCRGPQETQPRGHKTRKKKHIETHRHRNSEVFRPSVRTLWPSRRCDFFVATLAATKSTARRVCRTHFDRQSPMRKLWERSGFTKCQFNAFATPKTTTIWRSTDEQCCDSWLTRRISIVDLCLLLESRSFRQKARWKFVNISCCLLIFGYIRRFNDTRVLFHIIWVSEVMLTYFSVPFQNICCFSAMMNTWCRNSKITKIVLSVFRIWYFIKLLVIAKIR